MSADNWAICPRCRITEERRAALAQANALATYGVASPEDYTQALVQLAKEEATKTADFEGHPTFREDYEIFGVEDGVVEVDYRGGCEKCGLSLEFRHEHGFPGGTAPEGTG